MYAIGASMRACIEGKPPPSSIERDTGDSLQPAVELFAKRYPKHLLAAVDWAMRLKPEGRPQSAGVLRQALLGELPAPALP